LGATPIANARALEALLELKGLLDRDAAPPAIRWLTCSGAMGLDALKAAGFGTIELAHEFSGESASKDTKAAVGRFLAAGVDLVLFCGGDGTARDVGSIAGTGTPILGIPSGVKMYSGVFGVTPARTADILLRFLKQEIGVANVEILDLDEEKYRRGEWAVRLHMTASTPFEPSYIQAAKALVFSQDDASVQDDINAQLCEEIEANPDSLFLLGPGSTVEAVGRALGAEKTLLGIDAFAHGRIVGKDLNERQILHLLEQYPQCKLILSPIGAQGFVLGRGNQQLTPAIVRRIGADNIVVIATPAKLKRTPVLRFDTGDPALDAELISRKFLAVIIGHRRTRMVKTAG
jgi:predicted polyphosphate/ATP-dependent NAD kinase